MPEHSELFEINKKHLIGRLVTSTVSSGRIADISIPGENQFRNMLVLSASDLGGNQFIKVMDEDYPIFARERVTYKGQPVLAVFGYDEEDVELFCKEVKVSYQITPDSEDYHNEQYGEPFVWGYGDTDNYFTPNAKVYSSSFDVVPYSNTLLGDQRVFAARHEGKMHIRMASQWPIHVRKSVATVLGCKLEDVIVNPQPYYAPYDQLIVMPSVISCIAALAAEQSGEVVQLYCPITSWQPRMVINHSTVYQTDGTPMADKASCVIDLGAFPIFSTEVCHNILAGLVPVYPLKAAEVTITVMRSSSPPASFFGDLGYAMALAGTENHFSGLAASLGQQPGLWRSHIIENLGPNGSPLSQSVKESSDMDKLPAALNNILEKSWYSRKYASNSQKRLFMGKMNPLVNYSRGMGIATGEGIMGFSQQFNSIANYTLTVTLTEDEKLLVNVGIQADKSMVGIWKDTILQFLPIAPENITFTDINAPDILDLGPSALSRKIGIVSSLLIKACSELARKKEFSRLPISITSEYDANFMDPFYFSCSIGAVAVELHIDTVMLSPVIDNIWVNFHLGHVFDQERLLNKARHTITSVISEICPRMNGSCKIDIQIDQDGTFTASSLTAGLRGLTTAALVNALSQALGHTITRIPVTSDDILGIAKKNSEKLFQPGGDK